MAVPVQFRTMARTSNRSFDAFATYFERITGAVEHVIQGKHDVVRSPPAGLRDSTMFAAASPRDGTSRPRRGRCWEVTWQRPAPSSLRHLPARLTRLYGSHLGPIRKRLTSSSSMSMDPAVETVRRSHSGTTSTRAVRTREYFLSPATPARA